jgi:predicted ATPase/DNA-binding XRE family transcriptional regulator
MNEGVAFGRWLKARRQALDLTQETFADRVNCALSTVEKIERGLRRPSPQVAERMAEVLRVPPAERAAFVARARGMPSVDTPVGPGGPGGAAVLAPPAGNLPAPMTVLVGREADLAACGAQLARPDVRLLTLVGSPGIGKTRLGLAVAAEAQADFADGVWLVSLAALTDPGLVPSAIATVLGLKELPDRQVEASLQSYLQARQILLLLDNFEHMLPAAPLLARLLAAAPRLKVVVTSRAALHLYGEYVFDVPPLALPDLRRLPPALDLREYPAVALFVERAQAANPRFALTAENQAAVAEICVRLDGLPLALELAAARSPLFDPLTMLRRLDSRLQVLTGGPADYTARQQSLRAAIAWSYALLSAEEKTLFARLAVFAGGWTADAVTAVCADDLPADALDLLGSLLDKSLVQRQAGGDAPRFLLLETIREYAAEHLAADHEATVRQRHAGYYAAVAAEAATHLRGAEQKHWLERLDQEHDNLRAALGWALASGAGELAQNIAGALWRFWLSRGYMREGRDWLAQALAAAPAPTAARALALFAAGTLARTHADYAEAQAYLTESKAIYEALGDRVGMGWALNNLGLVEWGQGRLAAADHVFSTTLGIQQELGDQWGVAAALANLGLIASDRGDLAAARRYHEQSLGVFRTLGDVQSATVVLNNLGVMALQEGNYAEARAQWEECLAACRGLGNKEGEALALANLAAVARDEDRFADAHTLTEAALTLCMELGERKLIAHTLSRTAGLAVRERAPARAARLFGATDAILRGLGAALPPYNQQDYEHYAGLARAALGEAAFQLGWQEGTTLALEEAVAYAIAAGK